MQGPIWTQVGIQTLQDNPIPKEFAVYLGQQVCTESPHRVI